MSKTEDGGSAFPGGATSTMGYPVQRGMSLRDWFAGQALAGLAEMLSTKERDDLSNGIKGGAIEARAAYALADAMLAARTISDGGSDGK